MQPVRSDDGEHAVEAAAPAERRGRGDTDAATVGRYWSVARLWLPRELDGEAGA